MPAAVLVGGGGGGGHGAVGAGGLARVGRVRPDPKDEAPPPGPDGEVPPPAADGEAAAMDTDDKAESGAANAEGKEADAPAGEPMQTKDD